MQLKQVLILFPLAYDNLALMDYYDQAHWLQNVAFDPLVHRLPRSLVNPHCCSSVSTHSYPSCSPTRSAEATHVPASTRILPLKHPITGFLIN